MICAEMSEFVWCATGICEGPACEMIHALMTCLKEGGEAYGKNDGELSIRSYLKLVIIMIMDADSVLN